MSGSIEFGRVPQVAVDAVINNTHTVLSYNTSTGKGERIPAGQLPNGPFGNSAKFPIKCVRGVTAAQAGAGFQSREELDPLTLCLGSICYSEFADTEAEKVTRLVFNDSPDPANPLKVYVDGNFAGNLIDAKWVPVNSLEAAAAGILPFNPFHPQGYKQRDGNIPASIVTAQDAQNVTRFALALQNMTVAQYPQGIPAPVFDGPASPFWREASPPRAEQARWQYLTVATARALASEEGIEWDMPYILTRYGPPPQGSLVGPRIASVLIYGLDAKHYTKKAYLLPVDGSEPVEGKYDLGTDQFTVGSSDFSPAAFPGYFAPETQVLFEYNGQTEKLFGSLYGKAVAVGNLKDDVLERLPTLLQRYAMIGTAGAPSAVNPFVTDADARLGYITRIISARNQTGGFFQGSDNDLAAAVAFAGVFGTASINRVYNQATAITIPQGVVVFGNLRFFRLDARLTLSPQAVLRDVCLEFIDALGEIHSTYTQNNVNTPLMEGGQLRVNASTAAGAFLRLRSVVITRANWNVGSGTVILEGCTELAAAGTGPGFATVLRVGSGAELPRILSLLPSGRVSHASMSAAAAASQPDSAHVLLDNFDQSGASLTLLRGAVYGNGAAIKMPASVGTTISDTPAVWQDMRLTWSADAASVALQHSWHLDNVRLEGLGLDITVLDVVFTGSDERLILEDCDLNRVEITVDAGNASRIVARGRTDVTYLPSGFTDERVMAGGGGTPALPEIYFEAIGSANQSTGNTTFQSLAFDTPTYQTSPAGFSPTSQAFTVPADGAGLWEVCGGLQFQPETSLPRGLVYLVVRINGQRRGDLFILAAPDKDEIWGTTGARKFRLEAGDVVWLQTWNNTGGGTVWLSHDYRCFFAMRRVAA